MKKIVYIIAVFWCLVTIGFVAFNENIFYRGEEVILKIIPYDPRDLLRGDYVTLHYEIERVKSKSSSVHYNQMYYVGLKKDNENIAHAYNFFENRPQNGLFIKGRLGFYNPGTEEFVMHYDSIKRYYVKEGTGKKLEKDLLNGGYAKVIIDKRGNARIKEILPDLPQD